MHPGTAAALIFGSSYLLYSLVYYLVENYRLHKIARHKGCQKPYTFHHYFPLNIPELVRLTKATDENRIQHYISGRYQVARTHQLSLLGESFIATIEPENVKTMLATNFKDWDLGYRKRLFQPLLGNGIFNSDGKAWEHSRALLRPQFTRNQISDLAALENFVQKFLALIPSDPNTTVDLQNLSYKITTDASTNALFGKPIGCLDGKTDKMPGFKYSFDQAFTRASEWLLVYFKFQKFRQYLPGWMIPGDADFKETCRTVHTYVDELIEDCLRQREERKAAKLSEDNKYVFLEALIEETQDPIVLRDQLVNLLLAGRDTTTGFLGFTFWSLAENPEIYAKLRQAVLQHFGKGTDKISFETLKACKYLRYVQDEVLRLYPLVPANTRQATRTTVLPVGGGPDGKSPMLIKKGMKVNYNPFAMHRRKDIWGDDAEVFRPERWDPESGSPRPGAWDYIPFNGYVRGFVYNGSALLTE